MVLPPSPFETTALGICILGQLYPPQVREIRSHHQQHASPFTDRVPRAVGTDLLNQRSITQRSDTNTMRNKLRLRMLRATLTLFHWYPFTGNFRNSNSVVIKPIRVRSLANVR